MFSLKCPLNHFLNSEFQTSKKSLIVIIATALCVFSSTPEQKQAQDTLASWIKSGSHQDFVMIELRGSQDPITKVIGNNDCKPYNLPWPDSLKKHCEKLLKDQQIFLSCASGNRAGQAKTYLESLGYLHVYNVGGFSSWEQRYPDLTIDYKDTLPVTDLPKSSKRTTLLANKKTVNMQKENAANGIKISLTRGNAVPNNNVLLLTGQLIKGCVSTKPHSGAVYIFRR
jgi:rhodanese-related sulfurtransferase